MRTWTATDIKILMCGILPNGRTIKACKAFCKRNELKIHIKKSIKKHTAPAQ